MGYVGEGDGGVLAFVGTRRSFDLTPPCYYMWLNHSGRTTQAVSRKKKLWREERLGLSPEFHHAQMR